jgi:hypothetical protein
MDNFCMRLIYKVCWSYLSLHDEGCPPHLQVLHVQAGVVCASVLRILQSGLILDFAQHAAGTSSGEGAPPQQESRLLQRSS